MHYVFSMTFASAILATLFAVSTTAQEHPEATHPPAIEVDAVTGAAFPVVAFVREVEMSFPQSSDRVCPMFDPRTRPDRLGIRLVKTLYEPADGTLKGLTLRIGFQPGARAHGQEISADRFSTTVVVHHDVEAGVLKFLNIYGNIEDEQVTITCVSGENSGTVVTYQNRILGFHDYGVSAVTDYVESKGIEETALHWRDAILDELDGVTK